MNNDENHLNAAHVKAAVLAIVGLPLLLFVIFAVAISIGMAK